MRYIERKKDTRKILKRSIEVGPDKLKEKPAMDIADKTFETEDDLMDDDLKQLRYSRPSDENEYSDEPKFQNDNGNYDEDMEKDVAADDDD
ncbi:hypothetical protein Tco_0476296 [Tanacetum coccineum]